MSYPQNDSAVAGPTAACVAVRHALLSQSPAGPVRPAEAVQSSPDQCQDGFVASCPLLRHTLGDGELTSFQSCLCSALEDSAF